ncbi:MAG: AAA family ATPase [Phycisphaeraceae bacterium]|nr:AAA family ATPase [Phycisphaeraceae bacterium]
MTDNDRVEDPLWAGGSADAADQEAHRRRQRVLNLLRGRWHWLGLLALLLGAALATAGFFSQQTLYASSGKIQIKQVLPEAERGAANAGFTSNEFLRTEMSLITSPKVLDLVLKDEDWRNAAGDEADNAGVITSGVVVENERGTNLVTVSFIHPDPEVALAGLRAVMSAHKNAFSDKYESIDDATLKQLHDRETDKTTLLLNLRTQRDQLTGTWGTDDLDPLYNAKFNERQKIESALNDVRLAIIALGGGGDAAAAVAAMTDEELANVDQPMARLLEQRNAIQLEIDTYRNKGMGDNHFQVRDARSRLETIDNQIALRGNQLRKGLISPQNRANIGSMTANATLEELTKKEQELATQLETAQKNLFDIGRTNNAIKDINQRIRDADNELRSVQAQIENLSMGEIGDHIEVISSGSVGRPYNFKTRIKRALMGGMGGIAAALGLIMLWGAYDRRFRHITDAELDLPRVLGSLPTLPEKFENNEQGVLVAHAVHHIRTLLQIGREDSANVFSITSPAAGAGKTSLAMALGLSFASAGSRTLLIDGDVVGGGLTRRMNVHVHPRLGHILLKQGKVDDHAIDEALKAQNVSGKKLGDALVGLGYISREDRDSALAEQKESNIGLLEVCQGQDFASCIAPTGTSNLHVLPIGDALPQQAGVLSPAAIKRLVTSARAAYDVVLIDSGPILGSIEASMAAAEADGCILIISRGDKKALVDKCIDHFRRIRAHLIGVVFNHALVEDIERSSYGSVTASQSRHPNQQRIIDSLDADTSARFGPLATAVASYGPRASASKGNGKAG